MQTKEISRTDTMTQATNHVYNLYAIIIHMDFAIWHIAELLSFKWVVLLDMLFSV